MSRHLAVIMVLTSWMPQDVVATCDTAAVMAAATCIQQLSVPTDGNVATACQYVQDYMLCYPGECCTPAVETALASYRQAPLNCAGTTCGGTISQDGGSTTTSCAGTTCGGTISQDGGATTGAGLRGTGECSAVTWIADANIGWTGAETTEASVQTWEDCCNYCNPDVCCGFVLNSDGVCYQKLGSTCDLILDHTTTTTTPHVVGAGLRGTGECSAVTWTADANIGWTGAETTEASVQTWEDCCSYCNPDVCCGFVLISDGACYQKLGSTCDLVHPPAMTTSNAASVSLLASIGLLSLATMI